MLMTQAPVHGANYRELRRVLGKILVMVRHRCCSAIRVSVVSASLGEQLIALSGVCSFTFLFRCKRVQKGVKA